MSPADYTGKETVEPSIITSLIDVSH